jgi:hypothetical protein
MRVDCCGTRTGTLPALVWYTSVFQSDTASADTLETKAAVQTIVKKNSVIGLFADLIFLLLSYGLFPSAATVKTLPKSAYQSRPMEFEFRCAVTQMPGTVAENEHVRFAIAVVIGSRRRVG